MIDTTVVAWKNADTSRDALDWALSHHQQGSILIAHVADRNVALVESFVADSRAAQARVELMEVAERVRSENPDLTVHSELLHGDPVEALVRLSGPNTLAVVGSERHKAALPARSWSMAVDGRAATSRR